MPYTIHHWPMSCHVTQLRTAASNVLQSHPLHQLPLCGHHISRRFSYYNRSRWGDRIMTMRRHYKHSSRLLLNGDPLDMIVQTFFPPLPHPRISSWKRPLNICYIHLASVAALIMRHRCVYRSVRVDGIMLSLNRFGYLGQSTGLLLEYRVPENRIIEQGNQ